MVQSFMSVARLQLQAHFNLLSHLRGHHLLILILQSKGSKKKRIVSLYTPGVEVEMKMFLSKSICSV